MSKRILYFLFFLVLGLQAQIKITGLVVDEQDEPVPFANIIFKGSTIGTITNDELSTLQQKHTVKVLGRGDV